MPQDYSFEKRKFVIGGIALSVVVVFVLRLLALQLMSDDYRKSADSNAFRKEILYPSRGLITDRHGKLLVYNEPSYNILVTMQDQHGIDTADFCRTMGITREEYMQRMAEIKDPKKNPGYSRNTPQLFMSQIPADEFSKFREKLFRFNGFSAEKRSVRRYASGIAAHLLGDVAEVNQADVDSDAYYKSGDYIGKLGVERSYEKVLRGEKGMRILLRDVHGRTKGHYMDGKYDTQAQPGRNLTLGIDYGTQELAERLLEGKYGAIVAIEPSTGEILAMASAPTYDPRDMVGRDRGKAMTAMSATSGGRCSTAPSPAPTRRARRSRSRKRCWDCKRGRSRRVWPSPAPTASTTRGCTWAATATPRRSIWCRPSAHRATPISAGTCCAC